MKVYLSPTCFNLPFLILPLLVSCATSLAANLEPTITVVESVSGAVPASTPTGTTTVNSGYDTPTPAALIPVTAPFIASVLTPTVTPTASLPATPTPVSVSTGPTQPSVPSPDVVQSPTPTPLFIATASPIAISNQVKRFLLVNQDEQIMYVYENGIEIRQILVSTGAPVSNSFTPAWEGTVGDDWGGGPFRNTLRADFRWYLFPGPEGSILIHSVPYTVTGNTKIYDQLNALGVRPVSNGCVRISPEDAAWLKDWNPVEVPITITRWSGGIKPAGSP